MTKNLKCKMCVHIITIIALTAFIYGKSFSQENQNAKENQQKGSQTITAEQKAQIKAILSQYNAATLTAEQAKTIHEKFRQAGIHAGPETKDAIIAAGFDPEKLRSLAPPPSSGGNEGNRIQSSEQRLKDLENKIITPLSLNPSQKENVKKAFADFYAEMDKLKKSQTNPQERPDKTKIDPLIKARDEKIKQVLSNDQYIKYLELEKSNHPQKPNDESKEKDAKKQSK
jgi:hypothetical protein